MNTNFKKITSDRHPKAPGKDIVTPTMPKKPKDIEHIRADTQTHLDLKLEKAAPTSPKDIDERKGYEAAHHSGINQLAWQDNQQKRARNEMRFSQNKHNFVNSLPENHKQKMSKFLDHLSAHPYKHFVIGQDKIGGPLVPRLRHINNLLTNDPSSKLREHNGGLLWRQDRHNYKGDLSSHTYWQINDNGYQDVTNKVKNDPKVSQLFADKSINDSNKEPKNEKEIQRTHDQLTGNPSEDARRINEGRISNNDIRSWHRKLQGRGAGSNVREVRPSPERTGSEPISADSKQNGTVGIRKILRKAFENKSLNRIRNKTDIGAQNIVSHESHAMEHPAPKEFTDMANSQQITKEEAPRQYGGISAKMIHKTYQPYADNTWMSKPYHAKVSGATPWTKHPIFGWATMATKSLMNAAGLGKNTEEVYTHVHNGVPMTVHKFSNFSKPISSLPYGKEVHGDETTARQALKIAAMDFLTNNSDRHHGNLMIRWPESDLLAIDHERNFQYIKPFVARENPSGYLNGRATGQFADWNKSQENSDYIRDWWNNSGGKIKEAFDKEVSKIKDPHIREHIKRNFEHRHNYIQDWAENDGGHLFGSTRPEVSMQKIFKPRETSKQLLAQLPTDHNEALKKLDSALKVKRSPNIAQDLMSAWKSSFNGLSPQDKLKYIESRPFHHPTNNNGATYKALSLIAENEDVPAIQHILSQPDSFSIPSFWREKYKYILDNKGVAS